MQGLTKVEVLAIKHMNHFVIRPLDSMEAQRFVQMERVIQRSYSVKEVKPNHKFKVGSFVAVYVKLNGEKGTKLWLRGIVRENYHQKDFLYAVYFGDYGFDKTCQNGELRELLPYHYPEFVPFQAINFYLTDVDHKLEINREDVLKEIQNQFEAKRFMVWTTVEGKDKKGCIYGSILLEEDCDLAAILLEKELVNDVHYCGRNPNRKNEDIFTPPQQMSPKAIGPFRSGFKATVAHNNLHQLVCKCDAVLKYKRKLLRDIIKIKTKPKKKSPNERYLNSL